MVMRTYRDDCIQSSLDCSQSSYNAERSLSQLIIFYMKKIQLEEWITQTKNVVHTSIYTIRYFPFSSSTAPRWLVDNQVLRDLYMTLISIPGKYYVLKYHFTLTC